MGELVDHLEEFGYLPLYNYLSGIKAHMDDSDYKFEELALMFVTKGDNDYEINSYFKPAYVFENQIIPSVEAITSDALKYWARRSQETRNILLKSRYADLVWNFYKLHDSCIENPYQYAVLAVESYIEVAKIEETIDIELEIKSSVLRALELVKNLKMKNKLGEVYKAMIFAEKKVDKDHFIGLWSYCYDELIATKSSITKDQEQEIIQSMHSRLERLIDKSRENGEDNWHAIEYAVTKLVKYYFKIKDTSNMENLLESLELIIDNSQASVANVKDYRYKLLFDLYNEVQITSQNSRILRKIEDASKNTIESLKEFTVKSNISISQLESFAANFISDDLERDIQFIASYFIPKIDEHEKMLNKQRENGIGIISEIFPHAQINQDGITLNVMDLSLHENKLANHITSTLPIKAYFLNFVLEKLIEKHELNAEKLTKALSKSQIINKENEFMLKSGIDSYFQKDYIAFMHVIIPYIEANFRNLIKLMGYNIYKPNRNGDSGYGAILLGEILSNERLKTIMGEDYHFYIKLLYQDKRGLNLRNLIAHGLAPETMFSISNANLILHTLMTFLLFTKQ